ncbi:calcium-binding EGF-like domain-containing protein [Flavobacterium sp. AG291]|uniref:calcium-binding EGF-like domain-containing protein n=1 Tax=Flavobacterium sp. AG291 TaxID=2184000 RepID=UPI0013140E32|nr:calcium-binding EGF-like domain-containing protein [Flavobacterium sp. AG291]
MFLTAVIACSSDSDSKPIDLCASTNCQNGGECIDGTCHCPEGYYGVNCETEKRPIFVKVTNVVVKKFNGSPADIYIEILRQTSSGFTSVYESDTYYGDAFSPGAYNFETNLNISSVDTPHVISLFDYNEVADDHIGDIAFFPYNPGEKFPAKTTISYQGFEADVYFSYQW